MFSLSDGSNDNRLVVDYDDGARPRIRAWADGSIHVNQSSSQALPDGFSKIVGTLKTNESRLTINGSQKAVDTTGIVVGTMDRLNVGSNWGGTNPADGHIKKIAYYNTALTQTQAESLTS
jgi:hypothetical protein